MNKIEQLNQNQIKQVPDLKPGDTVRVSTKIIEGNKERIQIFEGVVIRVKGNGINQTFTVRKISYGIGVERTFLIQSPKLAKIQVVKRAKVRRAYLTYLRELRGKKAKLKDQAFDALAVNVKEEELKPEDLAPAQPEESETPAEEVTDAELTEISTDEDVHNAEVSDAEIAKEENKEAEADAGDAPSELGAEDQDIEVEETNQGLDDAQNDEEHENEMNRQ